MTRLSSVAAFGALAGFGIWLIALSVAGRLVSLPHVGPTRRLIALDRRTVIVGVLSIAAATLATRWWALLVLSTAGLVLFGGRMRSGANDGGVLVGEALVMWCERVRDAINAGAGLPAAIDASSRTAPVMIAEPVRVLSATVATEGVAEGLIRFSQEIDHPACDSIAMALVVADRRGGGELSSVLNAQIASVRHEIAIHRDEDAQRARFRTGVRIVIGAFGASAIGFRLFASEFFAPYDTLTGQLALLLIGSVVLGGMFGLVRLAQQPTRSRPFGPEAIRRAAQRSATVLGR